MRFLFALALLFGLSGLQKTEAQFLPDSSTNQGTYVVQKWNNSNGLPVNSVSDLVRGRGGYLWISTFDGLVRFDGNEFTTFKPSSSTETASISNRFIFLTEIDKGELLLHTDQGQLVLFKNGKFDLLIPDKNFSTSVVNQISKGVGNNTVIAANDGIWNYEDGELTTIYPNLVKDNILNVIQVGENDYWFEGLRSRIGRIYNGGISTIDVSPRNDYTVLRYSEKPQKNGYYLIWKNNLYDVDGENVNRISIFEDPSIVLTDLHYTKNKIYLSTQGNGFFIYDVLTEELRELKAHTGRTTSGNPINANSAGEVFMGYFNALTNEDGQLIFYIVNDYIRTFHIDEKDNIWIVTSHNGIILLTENKFETFTKRDGFINTNTYPIIQRSDGTVVSGSYGDFITTISPDGTVTPLIQPYSINAGAFTLSLLESFENKLYIGSYMNGLFELKNGSYQSIRFTSYDNISIYALYQDTKRNIWVGTDKGVFLKSPEDNWSDVGFIPIPTTRTIRVFRESTDGTMFMGTNGDGLYYINKGEVKHLDLRDGLSSNFVRDIYIDSVSYGKTQRILVATENNGLNYIHFDKDREPSITVISEKHGLYSDGVHQIFKDEFGRFWMGSNKGIFWVRDAQLAEFAQGKRSSISSVAYTEKDGLSNREVNGGVQPAGMIDRKGNIWFPTQGGPVKIDPGAIELTEIKLPLTIESIQTSDSLYQFLPPSLSLEKDDRTLTFKFTSLNIRESENIRFRYRLSPQQKEWLYSADSREALFSNLSNGNQTFEVQASVNGQNWENNEASVTINIPGYWYELWWVQVGGLLLILSAIGSSAYGAYKTHKKREYQLEMAVQKYQNDTKALETTLLEQNNNLEKQLERQKSGLVREYLLFRSNYMKVLGVLSDTLHTPQMDEATKKNLITGIYNLRATFFDFLHRRLSNFPKNFNQQWETSNKNINSLILPFGRQIEQWARMNNASVSVNVSNEEKIKVETDPSFVDLTLFGMFAYLREHSSTDATITINLNKKSDKVIVNFSVPIRKVTSSPDLLIEDITKFITFLRPGHTHISAFDTANEVMVRISFPIVEFETYSKVHNTPSTRNIEVFNPPEEELINGSGKATILIVDDEIITRTFIESVLSPYYNVVSLEDPAKAIEQIKSDPPSFIITDYYMPAMSGIEFISQIKETGLNVPLALLTGATEESIHSNSLRAGADIVLHKPINATVLLERISSLFRKHYEAQKQHIKDSTVPSGNNLEQKQVSRLLPYNDPFIDKLEAILEENYFDNELSVEYVAEQLYIDRSQLYRKLKKITGLSPTGVIQEFRLNKAREMITESDLNISEVALASGFNSLSYFSRSYKERFGESPSQTTTTKKT